MKFSVVLILAILISLLTGAYLVKEGGLYSSKEKRLNYTLSEFPETYDPALAFDDYSLRVTNQVFEPLYQYHYLKRPYEVIPQLAESMPEVLNDGKTYRIKIRKNIQYHNHPLFEGKKRFVKAEDFVRQIKRLAFDKLKSPGRWIFEKRLVGFSKFSNQIGDDLALLETLNLLGARAIDENTLEIQINQKDEQFIHFLTMSFVSPMPIEVLDSELNNESLLLFGTGPFELEKINETGIYLKRFEKYRNDFYPLSGDRYAYTENLLKQRKEKIPFLDNILFQVTEHAPAQWDNALEGRTDILETPKAFVDKLDNSVITKDEKLTNLNITHTPSLSARWLAFNMKDPIFGGERGKLIRLAIAHAVNRRDYIKQIKNNTCLEANSIYNPGIFGYDPSHGLPFEFNIQKAKELLIQAGYTKENPLPPITYSTRSDATLRVKEGEFIKEQLEKIGIVVNIEILKWRQFLSRARLGELQFWTDAWIYDYPDAENVLQLLVSSNHPGNNKTGYSSAIVDDLYEKYTKERSKERRLSYLNQIEKEVLEDIPWIMMIYETDYILLNKKVKNYRHSSIIRNNLKYIDLN